MTSSPCWPTAVQLTSVRLCHARGASVERRRPIQVPKAARMSATRISIASLLLNGAAASAGCRPMRTNRLPKAGPSRAFSQCVNQSWDSIQDRCRWPRNRDRATYKYSQKVQCNQGDAQRKTNLSSTAKGFAGDRGEQAGGRDDEAGDGGG